MWEVYLISTLFGVVNLFDNPARQTFVSEMVGRDLMPNAISLNSVVMNSARVIGPAIGGILIFTRRPGRLLPVQRRVLRRRPGRPVHDATRRAAPAPGGGPGQGTGPRGSALRLVDPGLRDPLLAMAVVGIFAFNFTTTLPLLATRTFHGGAGTYSASWRPWASALSSAA